VIVLAQLAQELSQRIAFLVHLHTSKQAHLHVLQLVRLASMRTHPHIFALHATQLAPPALQAQVQIVYLVLFHCISKPQLYSVWLHATQTSINKHLLPNVWPVMQAALLVQVL